MATRLRKGFIKTDLRRLGPYYSGYLGVGGRVISRCSYDRSVVERWLADRLAESPTYEVDTNRAAFRETMAARRSTMGERAVPRSNPFAGARLVTAETPTLWMVAAETNPLTARYHFRLKADWPRPRRVLCHDILAEAPISWIADDNGGEGFGSEDEARSAALAMGHDPSVALTVRPLTRRCRGVDDYDYGQKKDGPWQGE